MLTLRGIITLIVLVILFALAVVWISKQGGWKGEGCGGNCASCHSRLFELRYVQHRTEDDVMYCSL